MGNFVSRLFKSKTEEGLGLEDYRKLVNDSGFKKVETDRLGLETAEEILPVLSDSDAKEVQVLNREVEDARRVVEDSVEAREEKVGLKKGPLYKNLLEKVKGWDLRLSSLAFEVKLTEERLSGIRLLAKLQEKKPKEVTFSCKLFSFPCDD